MNRIKIQELSVSGCIHCASVKKILGEEIKPKFSNIEFEYIDLLSEKGQKIAQEYNIMSTPAIIINRDLFSVGGMNKNKLIEKIKSLS